MYLTVWLILMMILTVSMSSGKMTRKNGMAGCHKVHSLLERNISALWAKVNILSNPVHVHVHEVNIRDSRDLVDGEKVDGRHDNKMADVINTTEALNNSGVKEKTSDSSNLECHHKCVEAKKETHIHIHISAETSDTGPSDMGTSDKGDNAHHEHPCHGKTTHNEMHLLNSDPKTECVHARCDMIPNNAVRTQHMVRGTVYLKQMPLKDLQIKIDLYGFYVKNMRSDLGNAGRLHGIHVHEYGDFSNGCNSFGGHFNPGNTTHGHHDSQHRHVGDWGNIEIDHRGVAITNFTERLTYLIGPQSILGRGIVIHARADDEGAGETEASKTSGDAGDRIACCIIAWYNGGIW
ncbi:unnamed protein product [Lymnaea stagnalis]|uniref:Superoxide dismutase [Cu-Zn] n=1 Tax=Lymnaea stagnalis TaxID=6523 RepID=A0AAV2HDY8_LYMST